MNSKKLMNLVLVFMIAVGVIIKLFLEDLEYCLETDITIIDRKIDIQVCLTTTNQIYIKPYKNFKKKKNGHYHFLRTKVTSHQPKVIIFFFPNLKC